MVVEIQKRQCAAWRPSAPGRQLANHIIIPARPIPPRQPSTDVRALAGRHPRSNARRASMRPGRRPASRVPRARGIFRNADTRVADGDRDVTTSRPLLRQPHVDRHVAARRKFPTCPRYDNSESLFHIASIERPTDQPLRQCVLRIPRGDRSVHAATSTRIDCANTNGCDDFPTTPAAHSPIREQARLTTPGRHF